MATLLSSSTVPNTTIGVNAAMATLTVATVACSAAAELLTTVADDVDAALHQYDQIYYTRFLGEVNAPAAYLPRMDRQVALALKNVADPGCVGVKWGAGCQGPDGKIYCPPLDANTILVIDPSTNTSTEWTPPTLAGLPLDGSLWLSAVLCSDGLICCVPYNASSFMFIDAVNQSVTLSNLGLNLSDKAKWCKASLGSDGSVYGIPFNSQTVAVVTRTGNGTYIGERTTMGLSMTDLGKWSSGVLHPQSKKIYCAPYNSPDMLVIDTQTKSATRTTFGAGNWTDVKKWSGIVLGPDGNLYCIPFVAQDILTITGSDPAAWGDTIVAKRWSPWTGADVTVAQGINKWWGGTLGPDGLIYAFPYSGTQLLTIDAINQKASASMAAPIALSPQAVQMDGSYRSWYGGCFGTNGNTGYLYGFPGQTSQVAAIGPFLAPWPTDLALSPYLNRS